MKNNEGFMNIEMKLACVWFQTVTKKKNVLIYVTIKKLGGL